MEWRKKERIRRKIEMYNMSESESWRWERVKVCALCQRQELNTMTNARRAQGEPTHKKMAKV